jgi:hypothetical protein
MTDRQIGTDRMPPPNWTIVVRAHLESDPASPALTPPTPIRPESQRTVDARVAILSPSLDVQLFDNAAQLKIALSHIAMHLTPEWRLAIFRDLDELLDPDNWQDDSAMIDNRAFASFLRFIIFAAPSRIPSLGVGPTGHLLAAWTKGDKRIAVEFLPDDKAAATLTKPGTRDKETIAWRGHLADLKLLIDRLSGAECLQQESECQ